MANEIVRVTSCLGGSTDRDREGYAALVIKGEEKRAEEEKCDAKGGSDLLCLQLVATLPLYVSKRERKMPQAGELYMRLMATCISSFVRLEIERMMGARRY